MSEHSFATRMLYIVWSKRLWVAFREHDLLFIHTLFIYTDTLTLTLPTKRTAFTLIGHYNDVL